MSGNSSTNRRRTKTLRTLDQMLGGPAIATAALPGPVKERPLRRAEPTTHYPAHQALQRAIGHHQAGRIDEAITAYRCAITLKPDYAETHGNLGAALDDAGRHDEAIPVYRRAIELRPGYATAHSNMGLSLWGTRRYDEALAALNHAIELEPENVQACIHLGYALLASGDYERGFALRNFHTTWTAHPPEARWSGEPLGGRKVALHLTQGFGDTFQFVRYAPLVQARGGRVVLVCRDALIPILSTVPGVDQVVPWGTLLPDCDYQVDIMSLPAILKTSLATVPADVPYLRADAGLVKTWRERLSGVTGFRVGIVWAGTRSFLSDPYRYRSIPLRHFAALARIPGVNLINLQVEHGLDELPADFPVVNLGSLLTETPGAFRAAAAVVANLDLVVSCDTGFCHFAGALGARTWTALPYWPCWRWLTERTDSPWYPTMRLFRQTVPGEWGDVFARMAEALRAIA